MSGNELIYFPLLLSFFMHIEVKNAGLGIKIG